MAVDMELLEAMRSMMKEELQPVKADIATLRSDVDSLRTDVDGLRTDMQEGFDRMENLINVAAADAAKTERVLREHMETPHIA